jgi:hypothetical protein
VDVFAVVVSSIKSAILRRVGRAANSSQGASDQTMNADASQSAGTQASSSNASQGASDRASARNSSDGAGMQQAQSASAHDSTTQSTATDSADQAASTSADQTHSATTQAIQSATNENTQSDASQMQASSLVYEDLQTLDSHHMLLQVTATVDQAQSALRLSQGSNGVVTDAESFAIDTSMCRAAQ